LSLLRHALTSALKAYLKLVRMVLPVYVAVILLKHSPVLPWIVSAMAPSMGAFGLPGSAALVLTLGATINIYAAIAACAGLAFTAGQATTLALMLGFTHNLFVEGTLLVALSRRAALWMTLRIAAGIAAGLVLGPAFARTWPAVPAGIAALHAAAAVPLWKELALGAFHSLGQMFLILVPIVMLLEILQGVGALARLRQFIRPALAFLGIDERASEALLAGLFFGMVYGAGVILNRVQEEGLDEDQVGRLCLTLVLCHAIVEDTLLFAPVGATLWPVVVVRVLAAAAALLVLRAVSPSRRQAPASA
jgi:spore maturation protein SpmB